MSTFSTQNHLDILQLGQSFSFLNYLAKRNQQSQLNSYFSQCEYEKEVDYMRQELEEKIAQTKSLELEEEYEQCEIQEIEENINNPLNNRKTLSKWDDNFQIPHDQLYYNGIEGNQYAYELEFSQLLYENIQKYQIQPKSLKNIYQSLQEEINVKQKERRIRVQRYLQKKAKRCYIKKISYACRKTVADQRIRVKGRFVNKKHAQEIGKSDHQSVPKHHTQYYFQNNTSNIKQI